MNVESKFIEYARARLPARHQRPFKKMLSSWLIGMPAEDRTKLVHTLSAKRGYWDLLARDMETMFLKKSYREGQ